MNTKTRRWLLAVTSILLIVFVGPFLVPVPELESSRSPQELADEDSRFVIVNNLDVHYKQEGSGAPVYLLLHGFGASTYSWREVIDPLGEQGQAIAYDRPAFGLTERPLRWEGESPYSPDAQVKLVIGLLDKLGIEQAVLMGNSAGGTIALETALRHPERVQALILVDAAVYTGGGSPAWVRPLLHTPQLDHLGPLLARRIANRGDQFLESAWHDPSRITSENYQQYREPLQLKNWDRALWELTKASYPLNQEERLDQVKVPTLVITGDDDQIVPTEESIRLAREIPGADLAVIEDCGHLPQEECPEPFLEAVREFMPGLE
jgi:pimeloyl-ACP methyl ester carboxylesterase